MTVTSRRLAVAILAAGLTAVAAGCGGVKNSPSTTLSATVKITKPAPTFASAKNCQDMVGLAAKAAAAIEASGNSSVLETESTEIQALAKAAPSDIRGDFQTFAAAFSGFLHALERSGYKLGSKTPPTAAQAAAFTKAAKSFDTPKLRQAEQRLSAWARQNCKGVHVDG